MARMRVDEVEGLAIAIGDLAWGTARLADHAQSMVTVVWVDFLLI